MSEQKEKAVSITAGASSKSLEQQQQQQQHEAALEHIMLAPLMGALQTDSCYVLTELIRMVCTFCSIDVLPGAVFQGHSERVSMISLSHDGRIIASGGGDKVIRLSMAATGEAIGLLEGHTWRITGLDISHDDRLLASGSLDETVRVWDLPNRKLLHTHTFGASVNSVRFSPVDSAIFAVSSDAVRLCDTASGKELRKFTTRSGIELIAFSHDGQWLAAGLETVVIVWETASGKQIFTLKGHTDWLENMCFSPDRSVLARVWSMSGERAGIALHVLRHDSDVFSVCFSPDSTVIVTGDSKGLISLWSARTGERFPSAAQHADRVTAVHFASHGGLLISGSFDKTVRSWTVSPPLALRASAQQQLAGPVAGPKQ